MDGLDKENGRDIVAEVGSVIHSKEFE